MKKIDVYDKLKDELKDIYIADFEDYDLSKILCCDIWHAMDINILQVFIRTMAQLLCNCIHFNTLNDHKMTNNIAIEIKHNNVIRVDNKTIFNNVYNYIKPSKHYQIEINYNIKISKLIKKIKRLKRYFFTLKDFEFKERLFLATRLVMVKEIIEYLDRAPFFDQCKFLLIFQEHDTISNVCVQNAKKYGVKVISPQHGCPMNRKADFEQLFFDAFSCDYKLIWNDFTKKQFISAGIPEEKLYVVGNTKKIMDKPKEIEMKKHMGVFGVLLDCPINYNAEKYNLDLLNCAERLAEKNDLKYIIKMHPIDDIKKYQNIKKSGRCMDICRNSMSMEEYQDSVDFSIAHITSAIIDLIYDYCFVFIMKTDIYYPIETDDVYFFNNDNQLISNYIKWKENYEKYFLQYKEIVKVYNVDNSKELHDLFFQKLLKS